MEKIYKYFVIVLLTFGSTQLAAQANIHIIGGHASFPVKLTHRISGSGTGSDTSYIPSDSIKQVSTFFDTASSTISSTQSDDTIFFFILEPIPNFAQVHFILDTLHHVLRDFYSYNSYEHQDQISGIPPGTNTYSIERSVLFTALEYNIVQDTLLIVNCKGKDCMNRIKEISYSDKYEEYRDYGRTHSDYIKETYSKTLYIDTASYSFTATFSVHGLARNVVHETVIPSRLEFSYQRSGEVQIKLPPANYLQTLTIYDILGKKNEQMDIPPGATQYSLSILHYKSGHYFARLGNMTGHFVVY
jgi:hypothetical protein